MTLILGIDPGSRRCGFGLVQASGAALEYVGSGTIHINENDEWPARLQEVFASVSEVIRNYRPAEMAIEQVFLAHNAASALKLGQARGAAVVAATSAQLPVFEYDARKIKQAVAGTGAADKAQVQHMVTLLLKLPVAPKEDAADALAVAICHAHTQQRLIQLAGRRGFSNHRLK